MVEAFISWTFKIAETKVIKTAAIAVPTKVPATPSLEVKTAASTEAIPAATALYDSTTFCDFSSSTMTKRLYQLATVCKRDDKWEFDAKIHYTLVLPVRSNSRDRYSLLRRTTTP